MHANPATPIRAIQARPNTPYALLALGLVALVVAACGAPPASTWSQAEEWVCNEGTQQGQQDGYSCLVYGTGVPEAVDSAIFDDCYGVAYDLSFALAGCGE